MKRLYLTRWFFDEDEQANVHPIGWYFSDPDADYPGLTCIETISPDVNADGIPDSDVCIVIVHADSLALFAEIDSNITHILPLPALSISDPVAGIEPYRLIIRDFLATECGASVDVTACQTVGDALLLLLRLSNRQIAVFDPAGLV